MQVRYVVGLSLVWMIVGCAAKVPAPIHERVVIMKDQQPDIYSYVVRSGDTIFAIAKLHGLTVDDVAHANGIEPPYLIKPGQVLFIKVDPQQVTQVAEQTDNAREGDVPSSQQPSARTESADRTPASSTRAPSTATLVPQPVVIKPRVPTPGTSSSTPSTVAETAPKKSSVVPVPNSSTRYKDGWQWPVSSAPLREFTAARKGIDYVLAEGEQIIAASGGQVIYAGIGVVKYKHLIIIQSKGSYLAAYEFNTDLNIRQNTIVNRGDVLATVRGGDSTGDSHRRFHFGIWSEGKSINPKTVILK